MRALEKLDGWLAYPILFLHYIVVWGLFPALLILVLLDVFLRTFLDSPLSWGHELLGLLLISLFSLELPFGLRRNDFLSVDLLFSHLGKYGRKIAYLLSRLLILGFALLFCWQGFSGALEMHQYDERAFTLPIPLWPFSVMLGMIGALLVLQVFTQIQLAQIQLAQIQPDSPRDEFKH